MRRIELHALRQRTYWHILRGALARLRVVIATPVRSRLGRGLGTLRRMVVARVMRVLVRFSGYRVVMVNGRSVVMMLLCVSVRVFPTGTHADRELQR